jgi:dystroglycan 1
VSRWQFKLRATDSAGASTTETFDVTVQQHKGHRSVNHEITIGVKMNKKFENNVDWQIRLIRGIVETAGDSSMSNVVVREIRTSIQDLNAATFVYTNETLPKDKCPEEKLDELLEVNLFPRST